MGISILENSIVIENEYLKRIIKVDSGLYTKSYKIRPHGENQGDTWYPVFSFETHSPYEAAVTINGKIYQAGPLKSFNGDWDRVGYFIVNNVEKKQSQFGESVVIQCIRLNENVPGVELFIEYELSDKSKFLSKKVTVKNVSSEDIIVENVVVDIMRFINNDNELKIFTDYYWNCEVHDDYYQPFIKFMFPENVNFYLKPNESFESFKCYEAVTSGDRDEDAILRHRIYKDIAPWIKETYIKQIVDGHSNIEDLMNYAQYAKSNGVEMVELYVGQLFSNIGDYEPRKDIFKNGYEDMKKLVDHYHKCGLKVIPYCSTTIAWHGTKVHTEHYDWQYQGPDGITYNPYGFGNMCYQSPWGDYIKEKLLYLIDEIGFDGLGIDGPYHGLPCLCTEHKHKSPGSVKFMNWQWEKEFFKEVKDRGTYLTAPQELEGLFFGLNQRPGGYREEDQNELDGMDLIVQSRAKLYDARYRDPACATWGSCNLEIYHGHSVMASEENRENYDHAIGSIYGYGHSGGVYGKKLYYGEKTKDIYYKWINFYKKYRDTLAGEMVHLIRPTAYLPDAVMHISKEAKIPAVVVIYNPVGKQCNLTLNLEFKHLGFNENDIINIEGIGEYTLDSMQSAAVKVSLNPYEIKTMEVNKIK